MPVSLAGREVARSWFARDPLELAPELLGATLTHRTESGTVSVRLTEVEAYRGVDDPGSHAYRGVTPRTQVMFGEPGHLYVYFTYGMHTMMNIVASQPGEAAAVLLRAGEVIDGLQLARDRRPHSNDRDLARGPARLATALGVELSQNGVDLFATEQFRLALPIAALPYRRTPRTGVSGPGGAITFDWRFAAIDADGRELRSVLPYKRHPNSH